MAATSWITTGMSTDWVMTSSSSATWVGNNYYYIPTGGGEFYDPHTHFVFEGRILELYYQMDRGL